MFTGRLEQRHCPMILGMGRGGLGFIGYIDQVGCNMS